MPPEITILKLLLRYDEWAKAGLEVSEMPKELQGIYRCLNSFHEDNYDRTNLSVADLGNLYFSTRPRDRDFAVGVFSTLETLDVQDSTVHKLLAAVHTGKVLRDLSLAAYEVAEGRSPYESVHRLALQLVEQPSSSDSEDAGDFEFVTDDLEVLVNESVKKKGLRWRLNTLNKMLGSLRKGDFGFIFARPETGKTTFLASEVTFMAEQLEEEDGPILWLNNEEQSDKVMLRCYQASLGVSLVDLFRDLPGNQQQYMQNTHGKLKISKESNITKSYVEKVCKVLKPSLIIFDQIDKIKGFDNDREDLRLGTIYQWARELAKTYAPVIGVCQADGSGEGQKWLSMANVANAKTSKQAEADWILGIGKINEPGYDTLRYLHTSKNKLMGDADSDPTQRHGRMETLIEANVARYKDLQ